LGLIADVSLCSVLDSIESISPALGYTVALKYVFV